MQSRATNPTEEREMNIYDAQTDRIICEARPSDVAFWEQMQATDPALALSGYHFGLRTDLVYLA
jgi:hypothetical protein